MEVTRCRSSGKGRIKWFAGGNMAMKIKKVEG
jgi:hypothetical protein